MVFLGGIGQSQAATVLLTDNFDTNLVGPNWNNQLGNDQGGTVSPVSITGATTVANGTWRYRRGFTDPSGFDGEMALLGSNNFGGGSGNVYGGLDRNFASDANSAGAALEISFSLKVLNGVNPDSWGAIQIGSAQNAFATNASNKFASLFRDNGATVQFASGTEIGNTATYSDGGTIRLVLSDASGIGSAFNSDGATDVVNMYFNDSLIFTANDLNFQSGDGYITFASLQANLGIDDLLIQVIPEPSALSVLGLAALLGFRRRRD
jgi:hypothetical protein